MISKVYETWKKTTPLCIKYRLERKVGKKNSVTTVLGVQCIISTLDMFISALVDLLIPSLYVGTVNITKWKSSIFFYLCQLFWQIISHHVRIKTESARHLFLRLLTWDKRQTGLAANAFSRSSSTTDVGGQWVNTCQDGVSGEHVNIQVHVHVWVLVISVMAAHYSLNSHFLSFFFFF